jgi:hypothetical protein
MSGPTRHSRPWRSLESCQSLNLAFRQLRLLPQNCTAVIDCMIASQNMLIAILLSGVLFCCNARGEVPGISSKPDPTKRSVSIDDGYMVPYRQQVSGTTISFEMLPIPGGIFEQGSNRKDAAEGESPPMKVEVAPFWMGKCEVTWAEYKLFMQLCNVFEGFEEHGMRLVTKDNEIDAVTGPSKLYDPSFTFQ